MATTTKRPRNRAAQDVTLINLRALKARVLALERRVAQLVRQALLQELKRGRR